MPTETEASSLVDDCHVLPKDPIPQEFPRRPLYRGLKLVVEWLLSLLLVVMVAPILLVLGVIVKLTSPGPAFYVQSRLGFRGHTFKIIKLRTMRHNCEVISGPVWSQPGDARVTPFGRILRSTHLDELPQLFNVLLGHMSLVGPRPERPEIAEKIVKVLPEFHWRLLVRPGVTGLAQMRLPADSDLEGVRLKLAHDLYYVRNISFLVDLRVAFSTAFYFLGTLAQAVCVGLVDSYGKAVEGNALPSGRARAERTEIGVGKA
jgi:lipopolysaccharide/colanic/teichoic acid biosynthesis glycosyltransferase